MGPPGLEMMRNSKPLLLKKKNKNAATDLRGQQFLFGRENPKQAMILRYFGFTEKCSLWHGVKVICYDIICFIRTDDTCDVQEICVC